MTILDYLGHQRKLLPLIAKSYAIAMAQNDITARLAAADPDRGAQTRSRRRRIQGVLHLACVERGEHRARGVRRRRLLAENQLSIIRGDIDVFTTFEGDNTVLYQLVGKELLGAYADDIRGLSARGWVRFVATMARDVVAEKTAVRQVIRPSSTTRRGHRRLVAHQSRHPDRLLRKREDHLLRTCAQRLQKSKSDDDAFDVFNSAQDHLLQVGHAHTERLVLESMIATIAECEDGPVRELLWKVCDLFVYSVLEADLAWFLMHRHVSVERAKAVRRGVNDLCTDLRPTRALVDAFGIPEQLLTAPCSTTDSRKTALHGPVAGNTRRARCGGRFCSSVVFAAARGMPSWTAWTASVSSRRRVSTSRAHAWARCRRPV